MVNKPEPKPARKPRPAAINNSIPDTGAWGATGKIGPAPIKGTRNTDAMIAATATGIKLRGFHSNKSNSTASNTAATGVANTADMPAAAPATSRVLRSAALR